MNKFNIFHSVPEALTYSLLVLLIVFDILGIVLIKSYVQQIEQQQVCIVKFFLRPDRTSLTLNNLGPSCQDVIKELSH